jgi:hypothetical protein
MCSHNSCIYDQSRLTTSNRKKPYLNPSADPAVELNNSRDILIQAVERGLSVLGDNVAQVIFYYLKKRFCMARNDIVERPDKLADALEVMLGSSKATVERIIVNSICTAVGMDPQTMNPPTLSHCIRMAEKVLQTQNRVRSL